MTGVEKLQILFADESSVADVPFIERLAELINVNGGTNVSGWGVITSGGRYGRTGLEQDEALELLGMSMFVSGVTYRDQDAVAFYKQRIKECWERRKAEIGDD